MGVPQGPVLLPKLFPLQISNLLSVTANLTSGFADDSTLHAAYALDNLNGHNKHQDLHIKVTSLDSPVTTVPNLVLAKPSFFIVCNKKDQNFPSVKTSGNSLM